MKTGSFQHSRLWLQEAVLAGQGTHGDLHLGELGGAAPARDLAEGEGRDPTAPSAEGQRGTRGPVQQDRGCREQTSKGGENAAPPS